MRILTITLSLVVATGLLLTASGQDLDVELQRAVQRAVTTGDLDTAIEEYRASRRAPARIGESPPGR